MNNVVWVCFSSTSAPFFIDIIIYAYLIILQLIGITLAFQTRKVNIVALNDSKYVATIIYLSSILLVMMILVNFTLPSFIDISSGIFVGGTVIIASLFIGLTFIPRVGTIKLIRKLYTYNNIIMQALNCYELPPGHTIDCMVMCRAGEEIDIPKYNVRPLNL